MPIYEYQCRNCEHSLEKLQRMSDEPLTDCPECEQPTLNKLISSAAFKLKGTGWYETDFKDKKAETKQPSSPKKDVKSEKTPTSTSKTDKVATKSTD